jgi:hypothetical protein
LGSLTEESVPVSAEIVAMAQCDARQLGHIPPPANQNADSFTTHGNRSVHVGASVDAKRERAAVHAGAQLNPDNRHSHAHVGARAKQSIPPALRRAVLLRDQRRCRAPGCKNARYLDLHHITLRSEGGQNEPDTSLPGAACITAPPTAARSASRAPPSTPRFRHADGSTYGRALAPQTLDAYAKTFSALRHLGFKETQIRHVLAKMRDEANPQVQAAEELLRAVVGRLVQTRS